MRARLVWAAHLQATRNGWRHDPRVRFTGVGTAVVLGLAAWWQVRRLAGLLRDWQALGGPEAELRMWLLAGAVAVLVGTLSALGTLQAGFDADESAMLQTFPIRSETRFRMLYGLVLVERLGHLLLFLAAVLGTAFATVWGLQAAAWLLAVAGAAGIAAWVAMNGLFIGMVLLLTRPKLFAAAAVAVVALAGAAAVMAGGFPAAMEGSSLSPPDPLWVAAGLAALWSLLLSLGARWGGRRYKKAYLTLQSNARSRSAAGFPGARLVGRLINRLPGLTGAFYYKGWTSESRNPVLLFRLTALGLSALLFPRIRVVVAPLGLEGIPLLVAYCLAAIQVTVNETTTSAIAGESDRMILYLSAPIAPGRYLRAKYTVFLLPVGAVALLLSLAVNLNLQLGPSRLSIALAALLMVLAANTGILVWGSAWDEDLSASVEGALQAFLQEEAPITPRRMLVFLLGVLFQVLAVAFLWLLPPPWPLAAVALWCALAVVAAWRFGHAQFHRFVKGD